MNLIRRAKRRWASRRFHAFAVGPGKTGTVSITAMFRRHYRSAHEPQAAELIGLLTADMPGSERRSALARFVEAQDRLGLEMNSSHLNTWVLDLLVDRFTDANFVVLMRDCVTWTNSVINQLLNSPDPGEHFLKWRIAEFGRLAELGFAPEEEVPLRNRGLWPLSSYLNLWRLSYETVFNTVPRDRLLMLYTRNLSSSRTRLADFLEIGEDTIDLRNSHTHRAPLDHGVLAEMDPSFVDETVEDICGTLMRRWFADEPSTVSYRLGVSSS